MNKFKEEQRENVAQLKIETRLKHLNDMSYSKDEKWKKKHFS